MSTAGRLLRLFEGYAGAHGTHGDPVRSETKGGKLEIKDSARTVRRPVTEELWERHLRGDYPLGIITIREDATCLWGCIDVDVYSMDHAAMMEKIQRMSYPLVMCRSKSGGAHLYLFLSEPVLAKEVRATLRDMAAALGCGGSEIYPKQNEVLSDRGDLGNWITMPYLGGNDTKKYAMRPSLMGMTVEEFVDFAEEQRISRDQLLGMNSPSDTADESLRDGPPCMEYLSTMGFPEGTRNVGLFNLGIFCKKKFGARWQEMLEQYNRDFIRPPLPSSEVLMIIKNLAKKNYQYQCKEEPCRSYCNSVVCRGRKHGVGGVADFPVISGLSKLDTDEPLWFLNIEDKRVELSTRQLQNYREFHAACMDKLTRCFGMMKSDTWLEMVAQAMEEAIIIEGPPEASVSGQFLELLEDFCLSRHRGERVEDLYLGRPWFSEEDSRHYFRLRDLMSHLEREGFRAGWGRNRVSQRITELGGGKRLIHVGHRALNVHWVGDMFATPTEIPLPASRSDPI